MIRMPMTYGSFYLNYKMNSTWHKQLSPDETKRFSLMDHFIKTRRKGKLL